MSKIMDKEAALEDFNEKYVSERWQYELPSIDGRYKKNKESIENSLVAAFEDLCKNAERLQEKGSKGDIQYIYISFLRTSILDNTCFYRLDAYDEKWFLDKEECSALWDADFIFNSLFRYMEELEEEKKHYVRKITSMDVEKIKLTEALKYHKLTVQFLESMIPKLIENAVYKEMGKTPKLCILAGEYMDDSEILYAAKESEEETEEKIEEKSKDESEDESEEEVKS